MPIAWRKPTPTNANQRQFAIYDGAWYSANSIAVPPNGSWHHVAGTYDGTQVKFYLDGKVVASVLHTGVIATDTYPLTIGTNSEYLTSRLFGGEMDDVRVYHGVLSTSDIVKLANP
jgi:beta-galactosidase